jgi:hypothetical protein
MNRQNDEPNSGKSDSRSTNSQPSASDRGGDPNRKRASGDTHAPAEREEPIQQFRESRRQRRAKPAQRP